MLDGVGKFNQDPGFSGVLKAGDLGLWYSPALFGNQWMKLVGKTKAQSDKEKKRMKPAAVQTFVAWFIASYVLAYVIDLAGAVTIGEGLKTAFWLWLGFVAPTTFINTIWTGHSKKLWLIDNGHFLIVLLIAGALLSVWL